MPKKKKKKGGQNSGGCDVIIEGKKKKLKERTRRPKRIVYRKGGAFPVCVFSRGSPLARPPTTSRLALKGHPMFTLFSVPHSEKLKKKICSNRK